MDPSFQALVRTSLTTSQHSQESEREMSALEVIPQDRKIQRFMGQICSFYNNLVLVCTVCMYMFLCACTCACRCTCICVNMYAETKDQCPVISSVILYLIF